MCKPFSWLRSQEISLDTERLPIDKFDLADCCGFNKVRISLEDKLIGEDIGFLFVISRKDVDKVFKCMFVFFWDKLFECTVLEGSIPIVVDSFAFQLSRLFAWFQVLRQGLYFFRFGSAALDEFRCLSDRGSTLVRRGLILSAYLRLMSSSWASWSSSSWLRCSKRALRATAGTLYTSGRALMSWGSPISSSWSMIMIWLN